MATNGESDNGRPVTQEQFREGISSVRGEIGALGTDLRGEIGALGTDLRGEIGALRSELRGEIGALGTDLRGEIGALRSELRGEISALGTDLRGEIRGVGVMVERIDSNVRFLAEALLSTRDELKRDMSELEERLSDRIANLESAVRQNSAGLQQNAAATEKNSRDLVALTAEVAGLRSDFDHRSERAELVSLDERVTALEVRAGVRR